MHRFKFTDEQWEKNQPLMPGKIEDPGRTSNDNRVFLKQCCGQVVLEHLGVTCLIGMATGTVFQRFNGGRKQFVGSGVGRMQRTLILSVESYRRAVTRPTLSRTPR